MQPPRFLMWVLGIKLRSSKASPQPLVWFSGSSSFKPGSSSGRCAGGVCESGTREHTLVNSLSAQFSCEDLWFMEFRCAALGTSLPLWVPAHTHP